MSGKCPFCSATIIDSDTCPFCNAVLETKESEFTTCQQCGTRTIKDGYCSICGTQNNENIHQRSNGVVINELLAYQSKLNTALIVLVVSFILCCCCYLVCWYPLIVGFKSYRELGKLLDQVDTKTREDIEKMRTKSLNLFLISVILIVVVSSFIVYITYLSQGSFESWPDFNV